MSFVLKNRLRTAAAFSGLAFGIGFTSAAQAELVYAVTQNGTLISFNSSSTSDILSGVDISGLQVGEDIRGIDFRPSTGELFAIGSFSTVYTIDTSTGAATQVGGPFTPAMNGLSFGWDFNPVIDRIRLVSDANQNLVIDPNTGGATLATDLFFGAGDANEGTDPNVVAVSYTNSFAGAGTTQLYGIDTGLDILVTQDNSNGTLTTVGSLGINLTDDASFDISGASGVAYASVQNFALGASTFWMIDLATGNATPVGDIGGGAFIIAMSVVPAPAGLGVLGLGALCAARRRTR